MANQPALEPSSAPRDPAAYESISPFQIRILVQKLGGFDSTEKTAAWHGLGGNKQAQVAYALELLKAWDSTHVNGANGGVTHVAPIPSSAVAAVRPDATAAATAAAQPAASKKTTRAPMTTPTAVPSGTAPGPSNVDLGAAVVTQLSELAKQVAQVSQLVSHLDVATKAKDAKIDQTFGALMDRLDQFAKTQAWTFTTLLVFAENQMGASQLDLLRSAITVAVALTVLIQQVREELGK
jgi:hypothetical protein